MEKRSARDRETVPASLAPPAGRSIGTAAIVNNRATAFWAEWIAAIVSPADLAEDGLGFLIRHERDGRQCERLCAAGEEKMLSHIRSLTNEYVLHISWPCQSENRRIC